MTAPLDEHELRNRLAAFADGELDLDQTLRVLQRMAMDPQATRRAVHQQQLRQAVGKAMAQPAAPEALKQRIAELVAATPAEQPVAGPVGRIGAARPAGRTIMRRWSPLAMAAMLFIAALVTLNFGFGDTRADALTLEPARLAAFDRRHNACAKNPATLYHGEAFPTEVHNLPDVATRFIGVKPCRLDLTDTGYRYIAAGECNAPGGKAVHLLYESTDPSHDGKRLSLWIVRDDGRFELKPANVYTIPAPQARATLVPRRGDVRYYLMGDLDTQPQVNRAAHRLLAMAP